MYVHICVYVYIYIYIHYIKYTFIHRDKRNIVLKEEEQTRGRDKKYIAAVCMQLCMEVLQQVVRGVPANE